MATMRSSSSSNSSSAASSRCSSAASRISPTSTRSDLAGSATVRLSERPRSKSKRRLSVSLGGPPMAPPPAPRAACSHSPVCERLSRTNQRVAQLAAAGPRPRPALPSPGMSLGRSASCRLPHATSSEDCLASLAPACNATTNRRPVLNHHGAKPTRRAGIPPCLRLPTDGALSDPEDTVSPTTAVARPSISSIHTLGITAGTARPQSFHAFARRRSSGVFKATVSGSTGAVSAVFQVHGAAQFSHPATRRTSPIEILRPLQDSTPAIPRPPPCGGSNIGPESCSTLSSDSSTASSLLETDAAHLDGAVEAFAPAHGTLSGGNRRALRSPNAAVASLALLAGIPTKALPCTAAITPPDEIAADHTLLDSPLVLSKDASTYTSFPSLVDYSLAGCASDAAVVTCKATKPLMSHLTENSVVRMLQSGTKHHSSIMLN